MSLKLFIRGLRIILSKNGPIHILSVFKINFYIHYSVHGDPNIN